LSKSLIFGVAVLVSAVVVVLACAPRSQREALVMAHKAYAKDRCKGVLVRITEARRMSSAPLDRDSRAIEVECSFALEDPRIAEQRLATICQDFDWTRNGTAVTVIQHPVVYPSNQAALRVDGRVRFGIEIDDEGRIANTKVLESKPSGTFDSVAEKSLREWRYCPRRYLPEDTKWPESATLRFEVPRLHP